MSKPTSSNNYYEESSSECTAEQERIAELERQVAYYEARISPNASSPDDIRRNPGTQ